MTLLLRLEAACLFVSLLLLFFAHLRLKWLQGEQPLLESEVAAMRRADRLSGEPEYMQSFRVTESEGVLLSSERAQRRWKKVRVWCAIYAPLAILALTATIALAH